MVRSSTSTCSHAGQRSSHSARGACGELHERVPAERDRDGSVGGGVDLGDDVEATRGMQAHVDGDDVRERERAQLLRVRAVVEGGDDPRGVLLLHLERNTEQVAVDREAVGVVRECDTREGDVGTGDAIALAREAIGPWVHERDGGRVPGDELFDGSRPRDVLVVAEPQRRTQHRRVGQKRRLVLARAHRDLGHGAKRTRNSNRQLSCSACPSPWPPLPSPRGVRGSASAPDRPRRSATRSRRRSSGRPCASRAPRSAGSTPRSDLR